MTLANRGYFQAYTTGAMNASSRILPLTAEAITDLNSLIEPGEHTYASVRSDTTFETIRIARTQDGVLSVTRGVGTPAVTHRSGSTICTISPTVVAAIKDIVCNYDCCEDGNCPETIPPSFLGTVVAGGKVGEQYTVRFTIGGSQPCNIAEPGGLPPWASAVYSDDTVVVSGIPTTSGTFPIAIAVSNAVAVKTMSYNIVITD